MATPIPRVVSIISTDSISASPTHDQPRMITNLVASIRSQESEVLILHASYASSAASYQINQQPTLFDVANQSATLSDAIRNTSQGISVAKLMYENQINIPLVSHAGVVLNDIFDEFVRQYEVVLVDAILNNEQLLPLKTLNNSKIFIQLSRNPESITNAYTLIKQVCVQLGRRSFGIIADDATEAQAQSVFKNIAQVAKRFMQIELEFFGAIPRYIHLSKATKLGRSEVDAFPMTAASTALKQLAKRLDYKQEFAKRKQ
ncbi:MAG: MotR [Methylotenera sp.]|nr:MotR [Methylotenera sp.]